MAGAYAFFPPFLVGLAPFFVFLAAGPFFAFDVNFGAAFFTPYFAVATALAKNKRLQVKGVNLKVLMSPPLN